MSNTGLLHNGARNNSTTIGDRNSNSDFFCFTRGRFLSDESHQLSQSYVQFEIDELARLAVGAAEIASNGPRKCMNIEKMPDGMHNKAVHFTMDNGFQVVGKVPNPNAGQAHFTTASEVATMDFLRNVMKIPIPNVLSWGSTSENPVGAEYILMENVRGVQLSKLWDQLEVDVKFEVLRNIAFYQEKWLDTSFSRYGSLYYKNDVGLSTPSVKYTDKTGVTTVDDRFTIGPSVSRQNNDDGRLKMDFDRGPWTTAAEYERATGLRELHCTGNIPKLPRSPIAIHYSGTYRPSRETKILAIESYLKILKYLLPERSIQTSHIWHCDLHAENIFVNPSNPSEIYGIIDWQSTELAPLYDHAIEPYILDYNGPSLDGLLGRPKLADIRSLFRGDPEPLAERKTTSLYTKMSLVSSYRHLVHKKMPLLFKTLEFRETLCFQLLFFARNLLVDGEATYLALLADQQRNNWQDIPKLNHTNEKFPLSFSAEMLHQIEKDHAGASSSIELMREIQEMIGPKYFYARGMVTHDEYNEVRQIIPRAKAKFIRKYARDEGEIAELEGVWPFD
ncbi:uncharacterized protein ACLA_094800 [Aspergillus clavatus NRRL 1]|uniref:Altered inheritance of mitochondria protein 9, mitochondrial n=1 Tax=Aspergillus clavatus (strain ATCC 1007 / CBS 513.65 / DSM 816 / NCTC 3887 / NRRL 1 / QM 1276 / 107) TaxID=344612 RepID=A1CFX9_ASPCL|nr:uncharacterized protein ACLA_094800 [Aspergillus clavatus NRRL 1]EAW11778.1 hypothetical protein ACLA_094800 [Aspergillus clavatus NRRL 1]